jgi:hypothetical protein
MAARSTAAVQQQYSSSQCTWASLLKPQGKTSCNLTGPPTRGRSVTPRGMSC